MDAATVRFAILTNYRTEGFETAISQPPCERAAVANWARGIAYAGAEAAKGLALMGAAAFPS
jgi:hypothetical protein